MIERILYMIVAAAAGFIGGGVYVSDTMAEQLYKRGVEEGRKLVDWKELALTDQSVTNNICNAWWFKSDHQERRLKR